MDLMRGEGLTLSAYTYAAAMTACDNGGQFDQALNLLEKMIESFPVPSPLTGGIPLGVDNIEDKSGVEDSRRVVSTLTAPQVTQHTSQYISALYAATVPFNVAITAALKCGRIVKGKELFDRMGTLGVPRNTVTYTTMISGITKSKNFNQRMVLDVHNVMLKAGVRRNGAIFGAVIAAAEKENEWVLTLNLLEEMKEEGVPTTSFIYHSAISACGKAGKYEMTLELLEEMKERKVERTTVTYSLLINAFKRSGMWDDALSFLTIMQADRNEGVIKTESDNAENVLTDKSGLTSKNDEKSNNNESKNNNEHSATITPAVIYQSTAGASVGVCPMGSGSRGRGGSENAGLKPDTIVYSSAISVCVESQKWDLALELLEQMEEQGIQRNVVTYNTVIEALSVAGETHRSELVYQSALRTGIYNHWHKNSQHYSTQREKPLNSGDKPSSCEVMDLHNFPLAVAKVAVMLVLGEMCTGSIPIADPLVLITGRGNHATVDGQRGVLRRELLLFCTELGLKLLSSDEADLKKNNSVINDTHKVPHNTKSKNIVSSSSNKILSAPFDSSLQSQMSRNPGRLWLTKSATEEWLDDQRRQDDEMRHSGTRGAHGNMFLKVAIAKQKFEGSEKSLNVRAVCPFSSATHADPEFTVQPVLTPGHVQAPAQSVLTGQPIQAPVQPVVTGVGLIDDGPIKGSCPVPKVSKDLVVPVSASPVNEKKKCPMHLSVPAVSVDATAVPISPEK